MLLGDSITQGLGSKKINFTAKLQQLLGKGYRVENLALTGTTVDYPLSLYLQGKIKGDICVVLYGNVDAQIRPNSKGRLFPHIPKRFQGNGMLSPRPFYSSNRTKSAIQHLENVARTVLSSAIRCVDGTEQWVKPDVFREKYSNLLMNLREDSELVVCCSTVYIDDVLFPGSKKEYERYNVIIRDLAADNCCGFVDLYQLLKSEVSDKGWDCSYNKDHFHPNGSGYELMADAIAKEIFALR